MFRSLCACAIAAAFLISSTSGTMAASWHRMYNMQSDPLYGLLERNEMAGMAYMRIPFSGPRSKPNKAVWGLSVVSKLPNQYSHLQLGTRRGMATIMDLRFDGTRVDDLRVNGLSARQSFRRLNAAGDQRSSPWVTYGIMLLAVGAAAGVVMFASGDDENEITRTPLRANHKGESGGCGDGQGPGAGDGQGDGTLGPTDDRTWNSGEFRCNRIPGSGEGTGAGTGDGNGSGDRDDTTDGTPDSGDA
jgi:hypothetical protein